MTPLDFDKALLDAYHDGLRQGFGITVTLFGLLVALVAFVYILNG